MVLFNRSWYNRAGVERVMGFCTDDQYQEFLETVPNFEQMLVRSGIKLLKYYLYINREEQKNHLNAPWTVVRAGDKKTARVNVIKDMLFRLDYKSKDEGLILPDTGIVFNYEEGYLHNDMIAP